MNKLHWGSLLIGVALALLVGYFMRGRKKASA